MIAPTFAEGDLNINGFLSVGASMLDESKATIAGADTNGGFKQDTVLGLQVQKQVNDSTSATGQLVSRGSDDYSTEAAWAFITYAANDDLDIRMGRLRIPFFYYSDFLEVGYAYNWIRPPEEVYRIPFSSIDGFDISQRFSSGNMDGSVQFYYGRYQGAFKTATADYKADFKNFTGLAINANLGDFGGRISYHQAELILDTSVAGTTISDAIALAGAIAAVPAGVDVGAATGNPALAGFVGVGDASAAENFSLTGQTSRFYEAAAFYDNGDISVVAEWTMLDHDNSIFLDDQAWMLSTSKRMGDMTAHLSYSTQKDELDSDNEGTIQGQLPLQAEETSITLGLRYDYDSSTALKFEVQNNDEKTAFGVDGDSATLYSVAVDIVF
jgi:hypothetical protein